MTCSSGGVMGREGGGKGGRTTWRITGKGRQEGGTEGDRGTGEHSEGEEE